MLSCDQQQNIVFENVAFQYEGGAPIFEDLSLVIQAGKKTAIVGGSGSGYVHSDNHNLLEKSC